MTGYQKYGTSALWFATQYGRLPAVQLMLCHGADPAAAGPGSTAAYSDIDSIDDVIPDSEAGAAIRVLIDAVSGSVTKTGLTGLEIAIGLGDETTVTSLAHAFWAADWRGGGNKREIEKSKDAGAADCGM